MLYHSISYHELSDCIIITLQSLYCSFALRISRRASPSRLRERSYAWKRVLNQVSDEVSARSEKGKGPNRFHKSTFARVSEPAQRSFASPTPGKGLASNFSTETSLPWLGRLGGGLVVLGVGECQRVLGGGKKIAAALTCRVCTHLCACCACA